MFTIFDSFVASGQFLVRLKEHLISSGTLEDQDQEEEGQSQDEIKRTGLVHSSSERF